MSNEDEALLALLSIEVLYPNSGEVIEAVSGELLIFASEQDGRRLPLATLRAGQCLVGCPPTESGLRLLVTGLPGTTVRSTTVSHLLAEGRIADLEEWIYLVGAESRRGQWQSKVVAPDGGQLRLAPGEHVSARADAVGLADHSIQGWLQITSGSANFCGWPGVQVGLLDPPVPLTRGVWLTSGLRCRIGSVPAPTNAGEWQRALDLVGRLALDSCAAIESIAQGERISRLAGAEERALNLTQEGVDLLAGAITGRRVRVSAAATGACKVLEAGFIVARSARLTISDELRERAEAEVGLGRDSLAALAEACHARERTIDLAPLWWRREGPALLATTHTGESVALTWHGRWWVIIEPAKGGQATRVDADVAAALQRKATELVPVLAPAPATIGNLGRLAFATSRSELGIIVLMTILVAVMAFATPYVFGQIAGAFGTITRGGLLTALATLLLILVATTSWQAVRGIAMLRARVKASAIAAGAVWDRLMRLRAGWHDDYDLGSRMTQATAVNTAGAGVPDGSLTLLLDTVAVVGSLAAVATTTPALLTALTLLMTVQLAVNMWVVRIGARRAGARVTASAAANGRLMETLRAVNRLRISGAEARAFRRWAQTQAVLTRADLELRRVTMVQTVLIAAWPMVGLAVVVLITSASGASFADFVTAQTAAAVATATVAASAMASSAILNSRAILAKVGPVLAAVPEGFGEGTNPGRLNGEISVKDIVFRYEPGGPNVLDGVSFSVSPGEHVAIVGPSGCGKTTLMRILLGLEDPESGVVTVDGRDMASLDRPSVRRQIGCVLQSSTLLPGMIAQNIDMGRDLTRAQMWEALDAAAVGDDVRAMAMGLDTPVVDGGGTISGGQRQRILIARALVGNPRMLILDEATSALDNVTQAVVVESLERLSLTRIVVAHRLSTIKKADRIIVLIAGKVAQEGTFAQLMETPGHFRDLALRQLA